MNTLTTSRLTVKTAALTLLSLLGVTSAASAQGTPVGGINGPATPVVIISSAGPVWHPVTLNFFGPTTSETATSPNPFMDFRMDVEFTSPADGSIISVPGYYAGDGRGNGTGNIWRCKFNPDAPGAWTFTAHFRSGPDVAISTDPAPGQPAYFDGTQGVFTVNPRDLAAPGLLRDGRLEYVGEHYLKQRDGGFFVKTGTNSPENFMAYAGFDDVEDAETSKGIIHQYLPHATNALDARFDDPFFVANTGVNSNGVIRALNYLESQGVNSLYFLPMNLGGDGWDTWPFVDWHNTEFNKTHYDISRLDQWDVVLDHAQRRGILVTFVLAETEPDNETWLDDGAMGPERKLFFRELSARFGYLNGVKWTLCEETDPLGAFFDGVQQPPGFQRDDLIDMAEYLDYVDPYDHIVATHTLPDNTGLYADAVNGNDGGLSLYGDPLFDASSVQYSRSSANDRTVIVRNQSAFAGRKWIIDMDENGTAGEGLTDTNSHEMRQQVLYDVLFSNGNIEWYGGYHSLPLGGDLRLENFRTREEMWGYSRIAREFLTTHFDLPNTVVPDVLADDNSNSAYGKPEVIGEPQSKMAIFFPKVPSTPMVLLNSAFRGTYTVKWYNPRTGDMVGQVSNVSRDPSGNTLVALERAPAVIDALANGTTTDDDWIVLLEKVL